MPIIKLNKPRFRSRIALIDFDHTLVIPASGGTFPKNVEDWTWIRPNVPDVVKKLYKKGYGIYIVTNQTKQWKKDQITMAMETLEIPLTICIAFDKSQHKPSRSIYDEVIADKKDKVKLDDSFMCGDAMGRPMDYSDVDLKFAETIGIKCISPEELFPLDKPKKTCLIPSKKQEIVIMVGIPGSGKSTISINIFESAGYFIAHGDNLKTSAKMIKAVIAPIKEGKSVVFDATNASKKKRAEYIEFAEKYKIPVRCIHVNTSMADSMARNNLREKPVPRIVYNVYNKKFETPSEDEGFKLVTIYS